MRYNKNQSHNEKIPKSVAKENTSFEALFTKSTSCLLWKVA